MPPVRSGTEHQIMSEKIQSIRGMHDILPTESGRWQYLESEVRHTMNAYGYAEMRTPVMEKTGLFSRGIGEATDIVEKEMYTFPDRKGENLSLRPENTAGCVRAALQHGLMAQGSISRIWYAGPMFRYERPQKGRTRQFHQVGAEVYGVAGPAIEAELIMLSARLWKRLGIDASVSLEINTLGSSEERKSYRETLVAYFNDHQSSLDEDSQRRLHTNPLRILDSKNPAMQSLNDEAPRLSESLGLESKEHFASLQEILASCGIQAQLNPRLVRGLDYYSHSVWEWTTDLLGAQSAVCGGGRYDGLVVELGGKACPAVGWALGMERLLAVLEQVPQNPVPEAHPDLYFVVADEVPQAAAQQTAEWLRDSLPQLKLVQNAIPGSLKAQFKRADKSGARFALVLGEDEYKSQGYSLKPLRDRDGTGQQTFARDQLVDYLATLIP